MTSKEENMVGMMRQVRSYLLKNTAATEGLPNFGVYFAAFDAALTRVEESMRLQLTGTKGYAETKRSLLLEMTELTVEVAGRARAFAMNAGDLVLEEQMRVEKWPMIKLPDTVAADRARGVLLKARENVDGLGPYGIGEEKLAALAEVIEQYASSIAKPRLAIAQRKAYTTGLAQALRDGSEALKMLDLVVGLKRWDDKWFYGNYKNLRRKVDHSIRHLAMRGKVRDVATGEGLRGVRLEIALSQASPQKAGEMKKAQVIVKKSFEKGGFQMRRMEEGTWIIKASLLGYVGQELTVYVVKGKMTRVEIGMVRKG